MHSKLAGMAMLACLCGPASACPVPSLTEALIDAYQQGDGNFVENPPRAFPPIAFSDANGSPVEIGTLIDRPTILTIWSPNGGMAGSIKSLNDLLDEHGDRDDIAFIQISAYRDAEEVKRYLSEHGLSNIGIYVDEKAEGIEQLCVMGVPSTLLIDREGRIIEQIFTRIDWSDTDVHALIEAFADAG